MAGTTQVGDNSMPTVFKAPVRFDASEVNKLRSELERLATSPGDVVVDLARTEVIDGSGVGALVFAFKRLSMAGGRLTIRNVSGQPLDLLNASGLLRTLGSERPEGWLRASVRLLRRHGVTAAPMAHSAPAVELQTGVPQRSKGAA